MELADPPPSGQEGIWCVQAIDSGAAGRNTWHVNISIMSRYVEIYLLYEVCINDFFYLSLASVISQARWDKMIGYMQTSSRDSLSNHFRSLCREGLILTDCHQWNCIIGYIHKILKDFGYLCCISVYLSLLSAVHMIREGIQVILTLWPKFSNEWTFLDITSQCVPLVHYIAHNIHQKKY